RAVPLPRPGGSWSRARAGRGHALPRSCRAGAGHHAGAVGGAVRRGRPAARGRGDRLTVPVVITGPATSRGVRPITVACALPEYVSSRNLLSRWPSSGGAACQHIVVAPGGASQSPRWSPPHVKTPHRHD